MLLVQFVLVLSETVLVLERMCWDVVDKGDSLEAILAIRSIVAVALLDKPTAQVADQLSDSMRG
jgi:hypothetical protein